MGDPAPGKVEADRAGWFVRDYFPSGVAPLSAILFDGDGTGTGIDFATSTFTTGIDIGVCATSAINIGASANGVVLTGVTGYAIDIATSGFVRVGVQGTGIPVVTAYPHVMEIHAKTGSDIEAGTSGLSCGLRCRYEVGHDQTEQISMVAVEGRLRPKKDLGDGCHAGVSGTIEASEGAACVLGGTSTTQRNAGNFCVELGTGVTCTSGWLTGVTIDSSTASTVSMASCTYAGLRIKTSSGKEVWGHGIYIDADSATTAISIGDCVKGIEVGTFASPVTVQNSDWDTVGGAYTITKVMVSGCLNEDLSDSQCVRQLWSRFKITASQTAGSGKDYYGGEMQVRPHTGSAAIELAGGTYAGVWNYWENSDSANALTVSGGYHYGSINMVELCSTGVISGGTFAAANMTNHVDTDPASATLFDAILINKVSDAYDWKIGVDVNNCTTGIGIGACTAGLAFSGTITYFADLDGCSGANGTITSDGGSAASTFKCRVKIKSDDGTDCWINAYSTSGE